VLFITPMLVTTPFSSMYILNTPRPSIRALRASYGYAGVYFLGNIASTAGPVAYVIFGLDANKDVVATAVHRRRTAQWETRLWRLNVEGWDTSCMKSNEKELTYRWRKRAWIEVGVFS
jgi:hypothetical protein